MALYCRADKREAVADAFKELISKMGKVYMFCRRERPLGFHATEVKLDDKGPRREGNIEESGECTDGFTESGTRTIPATFPLGVNLSRFDLDGWMDMRKRDSQIVNRRLTLQAVTLARPKQS